MAGQHLQTERTSSRAPTRQLTGWTLCLIVSLAASSPAQPAGTAYYAWDDYDAIIPDPYLVGNRQVIWRIDTTSGLRDIISSWQLEEPHTFPGQFRVWWDGGDEAFFMSRYNYAQWAYSLYKSPFPGHILETQAHFYPQAIEYRSGPTEFMSSETRWNYATETEITFFHPFTFHPRSYDAPNRRALGISEADILYWFNVRDGSQITEELFLDLAALDVPNGSHQWFEVLQRNDGSYVARLRVMSSSTYEYVVTIAPNGDVHRLWPEGSTRETNFRILDEKNGELLMYQRRDLFRLTVTNHVADEMRMEGQLAFSDDTIGFFETPEYVATEHNAYLFEIRGKLIDRDWNMSDVTRQHRVYAEINAELRGAGVDIPRNSTSLGNVLLSDPARGKLHIMGDVGMYEIDIPTGDRRIVNESPYNVGRITAGPLIPLAPNGRPPTPPQYVNYLNGFGPFPPDTTQRDRNQDGEINSGDVVRRVIELETLP